MDNRDREMMDAIRKARSGPLFINILAKRVRQLQRGAKPLIEGAADLTKTEIATREFLEDKIGYRSRER